MSTNSKRKSTRTQSSRKKSKTTVTREQAVEAITNDWKIVKMTRNKDDMYKMFLEDEDFVKEIVGINHHILRYLPDNYKGNKEIVYDAIIVLGTTTISVHPTAFRWASEELKKDLDFIKKIREMLSASINSKRNIEIFDSFVPENILRQVAEVSSYWLSQSVEMGNFELFQTQLSILPSQREPLMKKIFSSCQINNPDGSKLTAYRRIFASLVHGQYGTRSLIRAESERPFSLHLAQWLVVYAGDNLRYEVTSILRSSPTFTNTIATEIGHQLCTNPRKTIALGKMLMLLPFGVPKFVVQVWRHAIAGMKKSSVVRSLDFSDSHDDRLVDSAFVDIDAIILQCLPSTLDQDRNIQTLGPLLALVIRESYIESAKFLLENGANDANYQTADGKSILTEAILSRNVDVVHLVLNYGVSLDMVDNNGDTALHLAVKDTFSDIVSELLRRGADPNIPNRIGRTAAFSAVDNLDINCIRELLNRIRYVHINHKDQDGNTLLHHLGRAERWRHNRSAVKVIFQYIMAHNPDLNILNNNGQTALTYTNVGRVSDRYLSLSKLLVSVGCGATWEEELDEDGQALHHIARIAFQNLNADMFDDSPVILQLQEDEMQADKTTTAPVRLQCGHVLNAAFLHHWLNEPRPGYEDSENPTKSTCPYCRADITSIELFSTARAANWDKYEGDALEEEENLTRQLRDFENRSEYKQYTANVDAAKAALKAAEEILAREEKQKKKIREASDAKQTEFRDKRLLGKLKMLRF